jgi:hypothetical protein
VDGTHAFPNETIDESGALHVMAYNMKRVMRIRGVGGLIAVMRA